MMMITVDNTKITVDNWVITVDKMMFFRALSLLFLLNIVTLGHKLELVAFSAQMINFISDIEIII